MPCDLRHTTSSVRGGGGRFMAWTCMDAYRTGSVVWIDDVTPGRSSRIGCIVYSAIHSKCCITDNMACHRSDG